MPEDSPPSEAGSAAEASAPPPADQQPPARPGIRWGLVLAAGLGAALVAWAGEEFSRRYVDPSPPSREAFPGLATKLLFENALKRGGSIAFGLLGGLLAGSLGFVGGLCRQNRTAAIRAAVMGVVWGVLAGVAVAIFVAPIYANTMDPLVDNLVLAIEVHAAIFAPIGAAAGLAFGVGYRPGLRFVQPMVGGLLGGLLAVMLFDTIGGSLFPADKTNEPLASTWRARLLARLLVGLCVAVCAAIAVQERKTKAKPLGDFAGAAR